MIRLENLSWAPPGKGRAPILDGVSFEIPSASYAVLMGRTGSGKTTLLEILCGLRTPTLGMVWIDDREVTSLPPASARIGYVPQMERSFRP